MNLRHLLLKTSVIGISMAAFQKTHAYANFIGYGYTSCQVCHFNAFGNGPLTDYGRALGATVISGKGPFNQNKSDEEIALASSFFGMKNFSSSIRPAAGFRGLALLPKIDQKSKGKKRYIPMQADLSMTVLSSSKKSWASVTLGYLPERKTVMRKRGRDPIISREHYLALQLSSKNRLFTGMMDIPFGIRTPDHTAYSRTTTNLGMNDQSHGLVLHNYGERYEMGLALLAGNLFQEAEIRQQGASALLEYDAFEKVRIGHSHLYTQNKYRSRLMNAVHARIGAGQGSAVLFELGTVYQKSKIPKTNLKSYMLLENMIRLSRGLHFMINGEYTTIDTFKPAARSLILGPALQYFPMNGAEIRIDVKTKRNLNAEYVERDSTDLMGQIHLWF